MGIGIPVPGWVGTVILIVGGIAIVVSVIIGLTGGEEVNPPPDPPHCYEWVDGDWQDICI